MLIQSYPFLELQTQVKMVFKLESSASPYLLMSVNIR